MNPIFRREFLARWRDWRSHLLLLGVAAVLGLVAYVSYWTAINATVMDYNVYPVHPVVETLATRASRAGHALFEALAVGNVAVWFILAPLLCATGVARERERGLLENLQLSPMSARSQVWARALSAMLYLGALQLVTLPIYFVAFSFGGISPLEIGRAWLVVLAAAWGGVGLGLSLSAASHRPSSALFGAVVLICGWSYIGFLGLQSAESPFGLFGLASGTSAAPLALCQALFYSHPVALVAQLLDPSTLRPPSLNGPLTSYVVKAANGQMMTGYSSTPFTPVFWTAAQVLPIALVSWFVVGALGLAKAARDVTRAFAPSGWAGRNPIIENWKKQRAARLEEERARAASGRFEGALLADLPFDKWIRFKNPLLNREVKGRFRLRQTSVPMWLVRGVLFLGAASAWLVAIMAATDPVERMGGAAELLWAEWILGAALVGTWAASGFAREREAGTWEGLLLSLMSNGNLARTKWASPLIAFALLTTPLWALLFAFAPFGSWNGTPLRVILAGGLVVASSLALVSALGNWVSLRARNTATATCCTLGLLLALFVAAPYAWAACSMNDWVGEEVTGVPLPPRSYNVGDTDDQSWRRNPEVLARYQEETGGGIPSHFSALQGIQFQKPGENERYAAWCKAKKRQVARVRWLASSWSPLFVLAGYQVVADGREGEHGHVNGFVWMALTHAILCAAAIAFLLGSATRRLRLRVD